MGGYSKEESFRMKIWMDNKAKIEKHNRHFFKVRMSFFKHHIIILVMTGS